MSLVFDAVEHRYFLDGNELPSVTTVLRSVGLINGDYFTDTASTRGTYVHKSTQLMDMGITKWLPRYPELEPYLDAWKKFKSECRPKWNISEKPAASEILGFAGTADREYISKREYRVWDIKTGTPQKWHRLQTAGYALLHSYSNCQERYCVYLRANGSYKIEKHDSGEDSQIFLAALRIWREKNAGI